MEKSKVRTVWTKRSSWKLSDYQTVIDLRTENLESDVQRVAQTVLEAFYEEEREKDNRRVNAQKISKYTKRNT